MGTLRFLLAISVIVAHTTAILGLSLVGGATAVQLFYMISGFYMALILEKKYVGHGSYRTFLSNRFLRIFPMYWAVLLLTFLFLLLTGELAMWFKLGILPIVFLIAVNILIVGQDLVMFLKFTPSLQSFQPTRNFWITTPPVHSFLLIAQAWTISLELLFYLIAPILVRLRTHILLLIIICSLLLRGILYAHGLNFDPWTYRFFPLEIAFFIAGIVVFRYYGRIKDRIRPERTWFFWALICGLVVLYQFVPNILFPRQILLFATVIISLPFLFAFSNKHRWDQIIGELSYPMYIAHILVLQILLFTTHRNNQVISQSTTILCIVITILFSWTLVEKIAKPIDRIRQRQAALLKVSARQ